MLTYLSLRECKIADKLNKLWNKDYKKSFPIHDTMFQERILEDENLNMDASFVAFFENMPIGFILIKTWQDESPFYKAEDRACISLIFVLKQYRNKKVGSELLNIALNKLAKDEKIHEVTLGNDVVSIFPGLPNELNESIMFFLNRGFRNEKGCVDMIKNITKTKYKHIQSNVNIRIATEEDKDVLIRLCLDNHDHREAYLIHKYFERGGTGRRLVVGSINNKIIGFSRIFDRKKSATKINMFTDKNVGSLGMLVVDKTLDNYEECKKNLSMESEFYLAMRKCKKIIIECTNHIEFYKNLGYRVFKFYLDFNLNLDEYRKSL